MSMTLHVDRSFSKTALVTLQGEVDLSQSPEVRQTVLGCLNDGLDVVVDLAQVAYIDSSGIASFIEAYQSARKLGRKFSLAAVSAAALRVLKLARLDEVFVILAHARDGLPVAED